MVCKCREQYGDKACVYEADRFPGTGRRSHNYSLHRNVIKGHRKCTNFAPLIDQESWRPRKTVHQVGANGNPN
uniref:DUF1540 domain-containing protein n=1 Tax=Steinernema glaseri TaxID=37863 RepID=A0A1I7Z4W7_9BILA